MKSYSIYLKRGGEVDLMQNITVELKENNYLVNYCDNFGNVKSVKKFGNEFSDESSLANFICDEMAEQNVNDYLNYLKNEADKNYSEKELEFVASEIKCQEIFIVKEGE